MKLNTLLQLYSNVDKKHRQLRGTHLYIFRFYILGALVAFGAVCFVPMYFSPLNDIMERKSKPRADISQYRGILNNVDIRSSKQLEKDQLIGQKFRDFTVHE